MLKRYFVLLLLICVQQIVCKRSFGGGGGRRTNSGGGYRPPTSGGGQHYGSSGTNYHPVVSNSGSHDTFHQSHVYQTGSSNPPAPHAPPSIGFEGFNKNTPGHNTHGDIGFENVQHRVPQQSNNPSHPIGFNGPPPNNQPGRHPTGFNTTSHGVHPTYHTGSNFSHIGGGHQPTGFNVSAHNQGAYPTGSNGYNSPSGYTGFGGASNTGQFGTNSAFNQHQPASGYYNPNLSQPGSYYQPYTPHLNGAPPPLYQPGPVQQSSSNNLLGYAGSFAGGLAGGYLIGKLTSGGHDNSDDRRYTVHHYYHNSETVPKNISVSNSSIVTCSQNDTQALCVPNSFPLCLQNGTVMCVTHTSYTVPCGPNMSTACIITVIPCVNGTNGTSACNTTANSTTNAIYIPCFSNVTFTDSKNLINAAVSQPDPSSDQILNSNRVELCVTAIAEPNKTAIAELKKAESPLGNHTELPTKLFLDASGSSKGQGYRQLASSGWTYFLIFLLWVGAI